MPICWTAHFQLISHFELLKINMKPVMYEAYQHKATLSGISGRNISGRGVH